MLIPKPLKAGDTIALIGVAGCIRGDNRDEQICAAVHQLEALGFRVKVDATVSKQYGYLSGTDAERADALNRAFADDSVDGIWCIRGGYGCIRLLDSIDYDMIGRHPKAFIGYSDITTLHTAFHQRCNLCTFHGPMPKSDNLLGESKDSLLHAIMGQPDAELCNLDGTPMETVHAGVAEGKLVGGNLSLIATSTGTPYDLDVTGKLLFLEEVDEQTYALDRYLQQLYLSGKLTSCAGVILGAFTNCTPEYPEYSLTLDKVLHDVFTKVNIPVVKGFQCGHIPEKPTLPLGRTYRLTATPNAVHLTLSASAHLG